MARAIPQAAGGLLSYFTRHRTAANLLLIILLVLGIVIGAISSYLIAFAG